MNWEIANCKMRIAKRGVTISHFSQFAFRLSQFSPFAFRNLSIGGCPKTRAGI
jgi:hypothetical protein